MSFDDNFEQPPSDDNVQTSLPSPAIEEQQRRQREYDDMLDLVRWGSDGGANFN